MKLRLKHQQTVPHGGMYKLDLPEQGLVGAGSTFEQLSRNVMAYRSANGLPIGLGLIGELENAICERFPDECEWSGDVLPLNRRLNLGDVIRGTRVMASFMIAGRPVVSRDEAVRRGNICNKCPMLKPHPVGCGGHCGELKDIVDSIIGGTYSTPFDNDHRACGICYCYYSAHIRLPLDILDKGLTDDMRTEFKSAKDKFGCWKVPTSL